MNDQVFNALAQEAAYKRETQKYKYNYTYTVSAIVNPQQTLPVILTIEQDADFYIIQITGSAFGPVNSDGIPSGGSTDFNMPGTTVGFAGRGLSLALTDTGAGRDLTNGYVPVELILTPGYDIGFHLPYVFKYWARRNSKLKFDFRNRDNLTNDAKHQIDIALNGYKYAMPEDAEKQVAQANGQA